MAQPEILIAQPCQLVLVVEGKDEKNLFDALLRHEGVQNAQVVPIGGKEQLPAKLRALRAAPHFRSVLFLGVIRDADADPEGAFSSVCGALQRAGLPVPDGPAELIPGPPRVGVFVMLQTELDKLPRAVSM